MMLVNMVIMVAKNDYNEGSNDVHDLLIMDTLVDNELNDG